MAGGNVVPSGNHLLPITGPEPGFSGQSELVAVDAYPTGPAYAPVVSETPALGMRYPPAGFFPQIALQSGVANLRTAGGIWSIIRYSAASVATVAGRGRTRQTPYAD